MRSRFLGSSLPALFVGVLLLGNAGCMNCWKRIEVPPICDNCESCYHCDRETPLWQSVPLCSKRHVYIFFVQGCDIFDCVNLAGVKEYVQSLGYTKTYHGQLFYRSKFAKEMARIRACDPDARFVVVGANTGAPQAYELTQDATRQGIPVDLLVYLAPTGLGGEAHECTNVARIVRVTGGKWAKDEVAIDGVYNVNLPDASSGEVPAHPFTIELLTKELGSVAAQVPYVTVEHPILIPDAPTPKPVEPTRTAPGTEWDFLVPQPLVVPPQQFQSATDLPTSPQLAN